MQSANLEVKLLGSLEELLVTLVLAFAIALGVWVTASVIF